MSDSASDTAPQPGWIPAALMMTMLLAATDTIVVSTAIRQLVGDLGGFALFTLVFPIHGHDMKERPQRLDVARD